MAWITDDVPGRPQYVGLHRCGSGIVVSSSGRDRRRPYCLASSSRSTRLTSCTTQSPASCMGSQMMHNNHSLTKVFIKGKGVESVHDYMYFRVV